MNLLQVFLTFFGLFMLYVVRIHRSKKHIGLTEYYIWILVWVVFIIMTFIPGRLQGLAQYFAVSRLFDLLIIAAFMILSLVSFYNYFTLKKFESKFEALIRERSLEKAQEKK